MKAFATTGDPTPLTTSLTLVDVAEPAPAEHEAVIAVQAFSVNRGEALAINGSYGTPAGAGQLLGQDVAGVVVQAAADGSGPAAGTRVVGHPAGGGWAERVAVSVDALAEVPEGVSSVIAAAVPLAGLTALRLLKAAGDIAGKRVLLTGASGGVGHYLVELALAAGARVTAVSSSAERGRRLAEFGASVVGTAAEADGAHDVIFESVGGEEFASAITKLAAGGTVLWYGQASLAPITLDFFSLFAVTPFTLKHFPHWVSETSDAEDLATLIALIHEGRLHPEIGTTADWADTASVLDDVYARRVRGNAVLTI
ncbi:MAG: zinc-binding dehydrogenase [Catenulispora sp.]